MDVVNLRRTIRLLQLQADEVSLEILKTPTGDERNKLCDAPHSLEAGHQPTGRAHMRPTIGKYSTPQRFHRADPNPRVPFDRDPYPLGRDANLKLVGAMLFLIALLAIIES